MQKLLISICALILGGCLFTLMAQSQPRPLVPGLDDYNLVWSDEFDGTSINKANWQFDVGGWGWGNNEAQYYTDGLNFECADGIGYLIAKKEDYQGKQYTSCRMTTQCKQEFMYGYIEVKMKAPMGLGLWPAIWTLGANFPPYNGYCSPPDPAQWPACGEMEIYETKTGPPGYGGMGGNTYIGTCHFSNASGQVSYNSGKYTHTEDLGLKFHVYSLLWKEDTAHYYFDGVQFWKFPLTASYQTEFHQKHFFLANIAVGGNYQGNNIDNSIFPQRMAIDYWRVFQKGASSVKNNNIAQQQVRPSFILSNPTTAELKIFDLNGKLVADLTAKVRQMSKGEDASKSFAQFNSKGAYVARLIDNGKVVSQKVISTK
jgi:beta-glucanase (GH16 family)